MPMILYPHERVQPNRSAVNCLLAALVVGTSVHTQNFSEEILKTLEETGGVLLAGLGGKMKRVLGRKCEWVSFFWKHLSGSLEGPWSISDGAKAPNTKVLIVEADRSTAGFFSWSRCCRTPPRWDAGNVRAVHSLLLPVRRERKSNFWSQCEI